MKWILIALVLVPLVSGKYFGYRDADSKEDKDTCNVESEECAKNQGIQGSCRHSCGALERAVTGKHLCGSGCTCCTEKTDTCDKVYTGSYCGPSPCEGGQYEITNADLCDNNHVCCKTKPQQAVAHPTLRTDFGTKGMTAHYHTFDDLRFRFGGLCTYLLMTENTTESSQFKVWANHARVSDEHGKMRVMVKGLLVDYIDHLVELSEGNLEILVDGVDIVSDIESEQKAKGSYEHSGIKFSWVNNQQRVHLEFKDLFSLEWDGSGHMIIELYEALRGTPATGGKIVGILGNCDGVKNNDIIEKMAEDNTYEVIGKLDGNKGPTYEQLIKVGLSWMKDCDNV